MSRQGWPPRPRQISVGSATAVASGVDVVFDPPFVSTPRVVAQIAVGGTNMQGATLRVTNHSPTGCRILLVAPNGATSAPVDWIAIS